MQEINHDVKKSRFCRVKVNYQRSRNFHGRKRDTYDDKLKKTAGDPSGVSK